MENETLSSPDDTSTARFVIFLLLIIVEIPAILCTLLILIFFLSQWHSMMKKSLHHHAVLLLTIVSFLYITLDLPFSISYYHLNYDAFRTLPFCLWWYWIDYTLLLISLLLTATASIQRHFLIFNSSWFRVRQTRWLVHYIPLILVILYPAFFYIGFIFLYPCETLYDEESLTCSYPCYADNITLYNLDWITNYISPVIIIVLANGILLGRVIRTRRWVQARRFNTWKKQRKLTIQLLSFSSIYVLGWTPALCASFLQMYFLPDLFIDNPQLLYIQNSVYFVCPLQSFISMFALPDLVKFIKSNAKRLFSRAIVTPIR